MLLLFRPATAVRLVRHRHVSFILKSGSTFSNGSELFKFNFGNFIKINHGIDLFKI